MTHIDLIGGQVDHLLNGHPEAPIAFSDSAFAELL